MNGTETTMVMQLLVPHDRNTVEATNCVTKGGSGGAGEDSNHTIQEP